MSFEQRLAALPVASKYVPLLRKFYENFTRAAVSQGISLEKAQGHFYRLMELLNDDLAHPYTFPPYHQAIRSPKDHYEFGIRFMQALVRYPIKLLGEESLKEIDAAVKRGENVILFANHQTEPDPQLLALALEDTYPELAEKMIFVAGERVITDPLAIPFSKGCNLLCIYSKRYIDHPPEMKLQKQLHNKKTMEKMSELLKEGGHVIYVAPSGGRDRKNPDGTIAIAPFDPQSIEMFILMARKAKTLTHFHTLALSTYELMPPPDGIQKELGEERRCNATPIGFYFGPTIDLEKYAHIGDKHSIRQKRAEELYLEVCQHFIELQ